MHAALPAAVLAASLACAAPAAAAGNDAMPTSAVRAYGPYSSGTDVRLGSMLLGTGSVKFAALEGTMQLEDAGRMPDDAGSETGGARVFRVANAEPFFRANAGRNGFCDAPVRWLGVKPAGKGLIRVMFLTLEDYRAYRPDGPGLCSGDTYMMEQ